VNVSKGRSPQGETYWFLEGSGSIAARAECSWYANYDLPQPTLADTELWAAPYVACQTVTLPYKRQVLCCTQGGAIAADPVASNCPNRHAYVCAVVSETAEACGKSPMVLVVATQPAACYLAGVRGRFDSSNESAGVYAPKILYPRPDSAEQWSLGTYSSTSTDTVWGASWCLTYPNSRPNGSSLLTYKWMQGQPSTPMIPSNAGVCFLTAVGGHFEGDRESVRIDRADPTSTSPQMLTGTSEQSGVFAEARCLSYDNK